MDPVIRQLIPNIMQEVLLGIGLVVVAAVIHPVLGFVALVGVLAYDFYAFRKEYLRLSSEAYAGRGRTMLSSKEATQRANEIRSTRDHGVLWGKTRIPSSDAKWHFCVVGAVGSGKTLTIRMLMNDQLPRIRPGSDSRALIYDAKQDMVQIVRSLNLQCYDVILNPFDMRAAAWHMSADIDSPAAARQLAETLVPDEKESQPFFSNAVRELLSAVVTVFTRTRPGQWTFRQLLLVMRSKELLHQILSPHDYTRETVKCFLECGETTLGNIMGTVQTKLGPYEPIAAAWDKLERRISIKKWLESSSILILGNDERVRSTLDNINRLFVALAAQHALSMSESSSRTTWFFFDEFSEAGKLPGLESIILRGRSKGCCVVLGFQDIEHVHEVYGEKLGNTLIGQCGNKAFLRIESPETAEWAAKCIGDLEKIETNISTTKSPQGSSSTFAESRQSRNLVIPSQFMNIPVTNEVNGLNGYYIVRSLSCFAAQYSPAELNHLLGRKNEQIESYMPAPTSWQFLETWSPEDAHTLRLAERPRADAPSPVNPPKPKHGLEGIERIEVQN